jgi:hypothetical protein
LVVKARGKEIDNWENERLIDALALKDRDLLSLIRCAD